MPAEPSSRPKEPPLSKCRKMVTVGLSTSAEEAVKTAHDAMVEIFRARGAKV